MKLRVLAIASCCLMFGVARAEEWPGKDWKTASPESQGMTSAGVDAGNVSTGCPPFRPPRRIH